MLYDCDVLDDENILSWYNSLSSSSSQGSMDQDKTQLCCSQLTTAITRLIEAMHIGDEEYVFWHASESEAESSDDSEDDLENTVASDLSSFTMSPTPRPASSREEPPSVSFSDDVTIIDAAPVTVTAAAASGASQEDTSA